MRVYFSDFFEIDPEIIEKYGAFNVSLLNDLPLFIDPFLLFNSKKKKYQELHENMLQYLRFLRDKSIMGKGYITYHPNQPRTLRVLKDIDVFR